MKNLKKFCAIALTLLMILEVLGTMVPVSATTAAVYFVDGANPNASNQNLGTKEELPWQTIEYGISQLQAGDTLYVKQGTYQMASLNVTNLQGSVNAQINICSYPGDTPVLYGSGVSTGCVTFSGCQYVTFSGFDVTNPA